MKLMEKLTNKIKNTTNFLTSGIFIGVLLVLSLIITFLNPLSDLNSFSIVLSLFVVGFGISGLNMIIEKKSDGFIILGISYFFEAIINFIMGNMVSVIYFTYRGLSFIGINFFYKIVKNEDDNLEVAPLGKNILVITIISVIVLIALGYQFGLYGTNPRIIITIINGLIFGIAFLIPGLVAKKAKEIWIYFIILHSLQMILYFIDANFILMTLHFIYVMLSIKGVYLWNRE